MGRVLTPEQRAAKSARQRVRRRAFDTVRRNKERRRNTILRASSYTNRSIIKKERDNTKQRTYQRDYRTRQKDTHARRASERAHAKPEATRNTASECGVARKRVVSKCARTFTRAGDACS